MSRMQEDEISRLRHQVEVMQHALREAEVAMGRMARAPQPIVHVNDTDEAHMAFRLFADLTVSVMLQKLATGDEKPSGIGDDVIAACFDQAARYWKEFRERAKRERLHSQGDQGDARSGSDGVPLVGG